MPYTAKNPPRRPEDLSDYELQALVKDVRRQKALTDLHYLAADILGYKDLDTPVHKSVCQVLQTINPLVSSLGDPVKRAKMHGLDLKRPDVLPKIEQYVEWNANSTTRLFLMFRGSFKTTLVSIAHTIQLMLLWPDIRILIASHKKEGGSQEILRAIKSHFTQNKKFRETFPEYCPKANQAGVIEWGTTEKVTLPNRSKTAIFPEATLEITGVTTDVTGRHYDYIKADDLVTKDSVTNEQMLEQTEQYNSLLKFLFNQPEWGIIDYSGTPYHFSDLYASLREQTDITKIVIPVMDTDGVPTVPERFSKDGIERVRNDKAMSGYVFSCQYMLNPVPELDQTFRPEWWKKPGFYYEPNELPSELKVSIFVDPANSQKKKSDYTALFVVGIDSGGEYWVLDLVRDKLDVEGRASLAIKFAIKYGTHTINYESVGFQNTDAYIIRKLSKEMDFYISVNELKGTAASKEDRIRALQPIFERGLIHFPKKYEYYSEYHKRAMDMQGIFNREAWMFPKTEHDDMIDCLSQMCRVSMFAPAKSKIFEQSSMFDKLRQFTIDSKKPKKDFHGFGNKHVNKFRGIPAKKTFF